MYLDSFRKEKKIENLLRYALGVLLTARIMLIVGYACKMTYLKTRVARTLTSCVTIAVHLTIENDMTSRRAKFLHNTGVTFYIVWIFFFTF